MYQAGPPTPFSDDELTAWRKAIEGARNLRKRVEAAYDWDGNIDRYRPRDAKQAEGHVNIGADFADVERKKAALFFTTPDISCVCDEPAQPLAAPAPPPQPGQPPAPPPPTLGTIALYHQQLLNELLSDRQVGIKRTVGKCLLDVLLPAGVGPVRIGYTATTESIPMPVPDPMTGMPQTGPNGMAVTQDVPVPTYEEFWVNRISPKALLLPAEFRDTDIRQAPWVGHEFSWPVSQVRAEFGVPEDVEIPTGAETPFFGEREPDEKADPPVTGVYLEYRAMLYGKSKHPKAVWCLALIDGMETPLLHKASPHQTFGPDGRLSPDSIPDYTILPLWIRDLPDSAWVPSDSTITGPLTKELNKFRTQAINQRENARHVILYDTEAVSPETKDKIDAGENIGTFVGVRGGALAQGAGAIMAQVVTASLGRESYLGQDYIQADREKILGIAANQQGAQSAKKSTATEASIVNRNTEARFNQEQARVLEWYLSVVRTLDTLVLRYGDATLASSLIGPRKGQLWAAHKAHLAGGYRYEVQVDSGKYMDAEASRRQILQMYQMTRQDPLINPRPTIEKLLSSWGIDPVEGIAQPQPQQPTPPPVGISFKGDDFNPNNPQFEIAVAMATQGGWKIDPQIIERVKQSAQAQTANQQFSQVVEGVVEMAGAAPNEKHGGPATQQMPISKRQADETGGRTGPKVGA